MQRSAHEVPSFQQAMAKLSERRIFFGHQSVGGNIIDGLKDLAATGSAPELKITESIDATAFGMPVFAHALIGKNKDPHSKLAAFEWVLNGGVGALAEIALMKLCYVDIGTDTNVARLFEEYAGMMGRLKRRYPRLSIVHVTVPLRTVDRGVKARLMTLSGLRTPGSYIENMKRDRFNALLREKFTGKEPLFDLAAIEATAPDGTMETFTLKKERYQALFPGYSNDGGHLTFAGREKAALGLLATLADLH